MATLEQTIKQGIKILEKRASEKINEAAKIKTHWRNRKVISVLKWKRMVKDEIRKLDYIPNDYLEPGEDAYLKEGDDTLRQEQEKWINDYYDYLEYTKNPTYGKKQCEGCILYPSSYATPSTKIIAIKWATKLKIINRHPCDIVNIFECPFGQGDNDSTLLSLDIICQTVDNAMKFAYENTAKNSVGVYDADFEKNICYYYGKDTPTITYKQMLIHEFGKLQPSKIPIHSIDDRYYVLTNKKKLGLVLEQYAKFLETMYYQSDLEQKEKARQKAERVRRWKPYIIDAFKKIMGSVTLDDLHHLWEPSREEIEKERQRRDEAWEENVRICKEKGIKQMKLVRSGTCIYCKGFSNITCINCNVWICDKHWKKHAIKHNLELESVEKPVIGPKIRSDACSKRARTS